MHLISRFAGLLLILALLAPASAHAALDDWMCLTETMRGSDHQRAEYIAASAEASEAFSIAPAVLVAIKLTESGGALTPQVINRNANGSVDRGYYQINTRTWLPELHRIGVSVRDTALHDVRLNALVAAWVLKQERKDRPFLEWIGRYHKGSGDGQAARQIRQRYLANFTKHLKALVQQCKS